jgi:carbonic anhydrase
VISIRQSGRWDLETATKVQLARRGLTVSTLASKNGEFVDAVAKTNVRLTVGAIRGRSDVLAGLEKDGKIKIVGSMYRLAGGRVDSFT